MTRSPLVLAVLCTAQFMVVLDASIVNVALPAMRDALAMPPGQLGGVVSGYSLFFGALLLLGGRLGDRFGRRRVFRAGLLAFALASLLGGLAWSGPVLVAGRAAQGAAAAVLAPAALSLITTTFREGTARTRALGVFGAVTAAGFSAGVLLGGVLVQYLGWRSVLIVNVPIGLVAAAVTGRVVARDAAGRQRLDLPGALCATAGLAALVYGLSRVTDAGWTGPATVAGLAAAVVLLAAFAVAETRAREPLLRMGLLRHRVLAGANVVVLLFGAATISTLFVLTLYLQGTLGYSPVQTGLALLPHALLVVAAAPVLSRVTGRIGPLGPLACGCVALACGLVLLARLGPDDRFGTLVLPGTLLLGLGVTAITVAGAVAATSGVDDGEQGTASGLFTTAQQLGGALGLATLTPVITSGGSDPTAGYRAGLGAAVTFPAAALAVVVALVLRGRVGGRVSARP